LGPGRQRPGRRLERRYGGGGPGGAPNPSPLVFARSAGDGANAEQQQAGDRHRHRAPAHRPMRMSAWGLLERLGCMYIAIITGS